MGCGGGGGLNAIGNVATMGLVPDITGSTAASNAKDAQVAAAQQSNAMQKQIYDQTRGDTTPWINAGQWGSANLVADMPDMTRKFSASDFQQDPGYQFALDQGMQAMQRSAAAKGSLNSVGTMQNLNNYAQGMASQQYQSAYDRFTNNQKQRYDMYSGLSGQGLQAAGLAAGAGQNYANQYGQNMSAIGNAQAASAMAGYNGTMNLINSGMKGAGMAMGMPPMPSAPSANPMAGATQYGGGGNASGFNQMAGAGESPMTMSNLA